MRLPAGGLRVDHRRPVVPLIDMIEFDSGKTCVALTLSRETGPLARCDGRILHAFGAENVKWPAHICDVLDELRPLCYETGPFSTATNPILTTAALVICIRFERLNQNLNRSSLRGSQKDLLWPLLC